MAYLWWKQLRDHLDGRSKQPQRRPRQIRPTFETFEDRLVLSGNPLALTQSELIGVAAVAAQRWIETGLSESQVEALNQITYQVRNLGGSNLALADEFQITIDDNAAGNLWFVDQTIDLEEEFTAQSPTWFVANSDTLADGKMDLLTAVMHEQGHVLGLEGVFDDPDDAMTEALQVGIRRLPTFGQAENAIPGSLTNIEYLTSDATGGGQSFSTVQPYNTLNYVVALVGLFPSRNLSREPYLGSVEMFAGNFAPRGYALAQGQLLSINSNQALFSILGTTYGGDGRSTFGLPDLRGRVPIGAGEGPDGVQYRLGQKGGGENVTLTTNNLASHTHTVPGLPDDASLTGGGAAFENRQPYLVLNAIVTLAGVFPSRNYSSEEMIGSVNWFAGNFAPRDTAFAAGQLLPIAQHTALFSILGTTYGGDGRATFGLPDLRGRMAIHAGRGPGLSTVGLGEMGGTATVTPTVSNLSSHTHGIPGSPDSTGATGGGQSFDNRAPYLGLNYTVSLFGLYPSRNLDTNDPTDGDEDPVVQGFVSGDEVLGEDEARLLIEPVIEATMSYWQAVGIDDAQVDKLQSVGLEFADLSSGRLASADDSVITLDRDASNRGWFIDVTPGDHVEFGEVDPRTGELLATEESAYYHFDLLTAILHEQGHILGLNHSDSDLPGDLMYGGLQVGSRKLPKASDLAQSGEALSEEVHFLEADPFIASVGMFAGNFAPRSWALTDGQLLSVASNDALFSLLGTTYGGDGRTTFGLPGLRGRAVVGAGFGPGLSLYRLGQRDGEESVMLTIPRMPNHTHELTQPADLTGNGFVDFQDLTILLANWNQVVSASEGNLVDAANTPVNFQDLTTLLAAWTGSGPAASPQAAVTELPPTDEHVSDSAPTRRTPSAAHRRIARRPMSQRDESPLRRLQATDRAMADYRAERDVISVRRSRRGR